MKKALLSLLAVFTVAALSAQDVSCFERLEKAFKDRGSYTVTDDIHRNVIISFFDGEEVHCVKGKARVENGTLSSIFVYFDDNTSELYDKKFYNSKKQPPVITNGISELAITTDGERFRVVFIDRLKPRPKGFKPAVIPDDL